MNLTSASCRPNAPALAVDERIALLAQVPHWRVLAGRLTRSYTLADFHATMGFANAIAEMIHQQDHHPELALSYKLCTVAFQTHSAGGQLTENDFICAARCDAIYATFTQAQA
jgi:4a-hydroxytetrahydrobiopterin dehydratase